MINYKHLRYFWMVAREGSIAKASKLLFLTPQTISGQLSLLEKQLGIQLFQRVGRNLKLTEAGKIVQSYANDIFSLGDELQAVLSNQPLDIRPQLTAGIANSIPKSIAYHILAPALHMQPPVQLICREDNLTTLLTELAAHKLDLVISDRPLPETLSVRCFNHHLGKCGITFFGKKDLLDKLQGPFPDCLDGAPMLFPGSSSSIKSKLSQWFEKKKIHPKTIAEFDDGALMKAFGRKGAGFFVAPSITASDVRKTYQVKVLGETSEVTESFYAISVERKVKHPGVAEILSKAREQLFIEHSNLSAYNNRQHSY